MTRVLVTGALGQLGTEICKSLRQRYGDDLVLQTDVRPPPPSHPGYYRTLDVLERGAIEQVVANFQPKIVIHLAALLSATGERWPELAWKLNVGSVLNLLEIAREAGFTFFLPSSIAAFGPGTPVDDTPQVTVQRPSTMYGITKVTGELLCDYYFTRYGVDTRGLRFPGLISHSAPPGGGTTDYAVEIFEAALKHGRFACPLHPDTRLDMMYMPDASKAVMDLLDAPADRLVHRNAYNVTAMSFTPAELAEAIRAHLPGFELLHEPDPVRQRIADSWPNRMDDSAARQEWGWAPSYDITSMVADMMEQVARKLGD